MDGYFKSARRKLGVVTLLLACVFAGFWARSGTVIDIIATPPVNGLRLLFLSHRGGVNPGLTFEAGNWFLPEPESPGSNLFGVWFSFPRIDSFYEEGPKIPHWVIVIPPTLLSAWLLFSKPRESKRVRDEPMEASH